MPESRPHDSNQPVFLALVLALFLAAPLAADEPPKGTAQLASGRRVEYSILFDRNSLKDSVRVGDGLIALASSGALLGFELPAVRLVRERTDLGVITCLGHGEGGAVLAGLTDGRVCRVEPLTLDLADMVKLPAPPRWIGWAKAAGKRPAGLIVVADSTKPIEFNGGRSKIPISVVNDLASGKTFTLKNDASAFLLDRAGRFWLGVDRGEWGGQIHQVDLARGTIRELEPPPSRKPGQKAFWSGVYGFIELPDGQIWAYGGTMHMGFKDGYVIRVDGPKPQRLFECKSGGDPENDPPHGQPRMPFTHILEEKGALRVFSYNDVFQVDLALKNWKQVVGFDLVYHGGRPDAVGSYPAIRAVHPPARPGEPYILATIAEGYVLLDGTKATSRAVPGQLEADSIHRIVSTPEAIFFHDEGDELPIWKLDLKSWKIVSLPAQVEPKPGVKDPLLGLENLMEGDTPLDPNAAIPWTDGTIMLATDFGLRAYDPALKKLSKVDLEGPTMPLWALAKDGLGRLWIGGLDGLWMVEAGAKTAESLERASWIGRSWVTALAPDPLHPDGVLAALSERGVVLVRALPKP